MSKIKMYSDPRDVFVAASDLEHSVAVLMEHSNKLSKAMKVGVSGNPYKVMAPIAINAALSTELFLKCLLLIDNGHWRTGHDLPGNN